MTGQLKLVSLVAAKLAAVLLRGCSGHRALSSLTGVLIEGTAETIARTQLQLEHYPKEPNQRMSLLILCLGCQFFVRESL